MSNSSKLFRSLKKNLGHNNNGTGALIERWTAQQGPFWEPFRTLPELKEPDA
jgi:hypothetical protein